MEPSNTKPLETTTSFIVDADDFCEGNDKLHILKQIKNEIPNFKISLFMIPGRSSVEWIEEMKKLDWIDMIPHGWLHPDSRECEHWDYSRSKMYLQEIAHLGLTKGFKAPGWQISDGMYQALLEEGYWVADQNYNNERRPKGLRAYILDMNNQIHGHIGHLGGHNANEIEYLLPHILSLRGEFLFIKDVL